MGMAEVDGESRGADHDQDRECGYDRHRAVRSMREGAHK
jgi:hypothetical protein